MLLDQFIINNIICPNCKNDQLILKENLFCKDCDQMYPIIYGIPILITKKKCEYLNLNYHSNDFKVNILSSDKFHVNNFGIIKYIEKILIGTNGLLYANIKNLKKYPIAKIPFKKLNNNQSSNLLDIGCGWGRWTLDAAEKGYNSLGIDLSIDALIAAKKISEKLQITNCHFVCCDVIDLPLKKNTFDNIFSFSFLQHFSENNLKIILKNIANKMKDSSTFKTQMINKYSLRGLYNSFRIKYFQQTMINKKIIEKDRSEKNFDVRYFSKKKIDKIFKENFFIKKFDNYSFFTQAQFTDYFILSRKAKFFLIISFIFNTISKYFSILNLVSDNFIYTLKKNTQ